MVDLPVIEINQAPEIRTQRISEEHSVVVVDDFLKHPNELIAFADAHAGAFSMPEKSYPGLLLDVDDAAMSEIYRFFRASMSGYFPFLRGGMKLATYLSMVTLKPEELSNLQRVCHVDPKTRPDRENYAALVYLFADERLGGTGFYRWNDRELMEQATAIQMEDPEGGFAFLESHFATFRKPAAYMTDSNEIAELLTLVPPRFNRLIFYPGDVPHSAAIAEPELLTTDFRKGRLTLNCFASVVPR